MAPRRLCLAPTGTRHPRKIVSSLLQDAEYVLNPRPLHMMQSESYSQTTYAWGMRTRVAWILLLSYLIMHCQSFFFPLSHYGYLYSAGLESLFPTGHSNDKLEDERVSWPFSNYITEPIGKKEVNLLSGTMGPNFQGEPGLLQCLSTSVPM